MSYVERFMKLTKETTAEIEGNNASLREATAHLGKALNNLHRAVILIETPGRRDRA